MSSSNKETNPRLIIGGLESTKSSPIIVYDSDEDVVNLDDFASKKGLEKERETEVRVEIREREREVREREREVRERERVVRERQDKKKPTPEELQKRLDIIVGLYYDSKPYQYNNGKVAELEVRFGTRGAKPLSKNDYDNVIRKLKSLGFKCTNPEGAYMLRMQNEIINSQGKFSLSPIRVEIDGLTNIQEYCRTNDIKSMSQSSSPTYNISINKKTSAMLNERPIYPVNFDDFNFRISYNIEEAINRNGSKFGIEIINSWDKSKKIFRYINRVTFIHTDYPIQIDLSIVRSSNKLDKYNLKPEYTAEQSGVFTNPESYEIEIEVVNSKLQDFYVVDPVLQGIRKAIKFVLSGLQGTNYPVSDLEQSQVANEYMQLMFGKEYTMPWYGLKPGSFIGPSSYTLQTENIAPVNENTNIPNIRKGYTVTDKADGERRLMIISSVGKIYLISTNMSVIFTGAVTT